MPRRYRGSATSGGRNFRLVESQLPRLAEAQQLSEVVAKIAASESINTMEAKIVRARGSLGGAKPKALIAIGGEQWVIKFFNSDPVDTPSSSTRR